MSDRTKKNYKNYYEIIEVIGFGGGGYVYKGKEKATKELRAIKVISLEKIEEYLLSQYETEEIKEQLNLCINGFIEEFNNMKICSNNNNNSVKCYEYFNNKDNFVIIMELCDLNLSQLLKQRLLNNKKGFNIEEIYEIISQLNNTFKIMKKNNIIHRDLKLENILIKFNDKEHKKYTIKLSDYGSSKRLKSLSMNCNSYLGTLVYMAPEILKRKEYNSKCDLWSIGIIIYRLIFGKSPYSGENEIALLNNINKYGNKIIKIENKELEDLVKKLLEKEVIKRIDWDKYFNHIFFKSKLENIKLINYVDGENEVKDIFGKCIDGKFKKFGDKLFENNKNNIDLKINGIYSLRKSYSPNIPNYKRFESDIQSKIVNEVSNPILRNTYSISPQFFRENENNRKYLNDKNDMNDEDFDEFNNLSTTMDYLSKTNRENEKNREYLNIENDMDDEDDDKFHDLSSTIDYLNRTTPLNKIQNQQNDLNPFAKQLQFNYNRIPNKARKTIFEKLSPLNKTNLNNSNPFNRPPIINSYQFNRHIINQINNNMNAIRGRKSFPSNNPILKIQMIEGNPIQSNINNQNSSLGISPIKFNEIINQNSGKNHANNLRSIPIINQSENQNNLMTINKNYITQNQAIMTLLNKNQLFQQQPSIYINQMNNQNEYGLNNHPMINQNQMISEKNNLNSNEQINKDEDQIPKENINLEFLTDLDGNLPNIEWSKYKKINQEEGEYDQNQNQNMANENNEYKKKNDLLILYEDFDDSGWIKNYAGVSSPGRNIKGEQIKNQDSFVSLTNINNIIDFNIFGVLDGHGPQGHNVSQFASEFIPAQITNHPEIKVLSDPEAIYEKLKENNCQIITNAYLACDEQLKNAEFDAYNSGSTCILIIHIGSHIICSNVGDSRGLVSFIEQIEGDDKLNYLKEVPLSIDYKPDLFEEQERILSYGGVVEKMKNKFGQEVGPYRVWAKGEEFPGLAMSRSIGDLNGKNFGIIPDPGILEYDLNQSTKFIVVCSHGVWEFLTNENVIDLGKSFYINNDVSGFCHQIVNQSILQWEKNDIIIDDITVVVAFFNI